MRLAIAALLVAGAASLAIVPAPGSFAIALPVMVATFLLGGARLALDLIELDAVELAADAGLLVAVGVALVQIPREYADLRERDPELARAWRDALAEAVEACLAAGLVAAGFDGPTGAYVMAEDAGA